jgi:hypothetical protein
MLKREGGKKYWPDMDGYYRKTDNGTFKTPSNHEFAVLTKKYWQIRIRISIHI